ncbi:Clp1/GlmU family protein [Nitrosococcus wardiae]|uniref:Clp1 P-loop domain-containing protein n=1 Tax=Nitrosococcus wardiae TaxID=1814290 RepID=A0A4P7C321_9GAMM|nr:Clp1/GlmU family protein [Nitrosococcus wardiae]QBQ56169.1 hypothetical protein E3U44_17920 [Nitrosococcus wardiae]
MSAIDIPASWRTAAEQILKQQWHRILVIGATDRGKSTYCGFLGQTLSAAGLKVAFVDADVGQKDVGPPATISLAYFDEALELSQTPLAALYFVGAVSPIGHFLPVVVGTKRMVEAAQASFVIIDTSGLVTGSGRVLKAFQIDSLCPQVIVALEKEQELGPIIRACRNYNMIRLRSSPQTKAKPIHIRRAAREQAFRTYFKDAKEHRLRLRQLVIQRGVVSTRLANHLLCGLADSQGEGLGLAIVRKVDFRRGTVSLLTPVARQAIRILQFGDLYLRADGSELPSSSQGARSSAK